MPLASFSWSRESSKMSSKFMKLILNFSNNEKQRMDHIVNLMQCQAPVLGIPIIVMAGTRSVMFSPESALCKIKCIPSFFVTATWLQSPEKQLIINNWKLNKSFNLIDDRSRIEKTVEPPAHGYSAILARQNRLLWYMIQNRNFSARNSSQIPTLFPASKRIYHHGIP